MKQKSWISIVFSFAAQCRLKIILSVLCAIISVIAGLPGQRKGGNRYVQDCKTSD